MTFTTSGDVNDLRMRVRHMASMRNRMAGMHGQGEMGGGMGRGGMHGGHMGMMQVPAHASVDDVPGGARLVLTPVDPAERDALREQTRAQAAMMERGECPMLQAEPASPRARQPSPTAG